ncbi:hypothetical protein SAMN05421784_12341 [Xenorhabdus koppenhoeferi]|uniref:Uncharacterized protein n=1 Tax=Xenorhabdus koppenhoeferi TaxID=351659 RepID=A0A1I7IT81_9GAMM|nr:hypothetical protein SAMN05421784_12341 [Xenorhabdus koppenhoeferi]
MTTLMGDLIGQGQEEQIVVRDENSWLVEIDQLLVTKIVDTTGQINQSSTEQSYEA